MDNQLLIKKIQAILHDPPEKPIILGRIGHEGRAKDLMAEIMGKGDAKIPEEVRTADHIASAADRINLPKDEGFISDFRKNPVIIHPLSGKGFDLKSLAQVEIGEITAAVDRSFVYLSDKYENDMEKLYLALWRELLDLLIKKPEKQSRLGQLWELLPADTRIPDHSIWEHKRITSAIAGALPKPAFLLFAIGPVQEFIAAARKTQDLWAGSYLLSYLSWSAMKVVSEKFGPDSMIFPDLCRQPVADLWLREKGLEFEGDIGREELSSPTLPNRFLAIVPESSVADIANKAKEAVKETFRSVCNAVNDKMAEELEISSGEWDAIWHRQTEDFIETYWAATAVDNYTEFLSTYKSLLDIKPDWKFDKLFKEYEKGFATNIGTVYGQIYSLTEKALGSRKAVRDFKQQSEPNYKCTLCGVREPVHPGIYKDKSCLNEFGALKGFWQDTVMPVFPQIRKSERLCGVCVTKRLSSKYYFKDILKFDIVDNFPSVSMVATSAFKLRVIENISYNNLAVKVDQFVKGVQELVADRWSGIPMPMVIRACRDEICRDFARIEGDWLYKEAFDDKKALLEENKKRFQDDEYTFNRLIDNARKKQQDLFAAIKEFDKGKDKDKQIGSPSTYYAVLLMDGDNMGKWLAGEIAPTIENILHPSVRNSLDTRWDELKKMERPLNPSLHLAMSKALRDFSLKVAREIVEKGHLGKLVYAGGDDVLAFVNLRDLPEVMRKLRAYFSGSLKSDTETNKVTIDFKNGSGFIPVDDKGYPLNVDKHERHINGFMSSMGTKATASMGIVIAHHSSNLSKVLEEVRGCEKHAKKLKDKNAFCIALAKRAGGTEYIKAKWYYEDFHESIPWLIEWADAFHNDNISPKFVYTFRTETKGLEYEDSNGKKNRLPEEAIGLELQRIAKRQTKGNNHDKVEDLIDGLMQLHSGGLSIDDLGKFLSVAAFLGREGNR
ncbi:MAG: type III-B CRISPR-associated protein Cas10/Cmr2 [Nitrospirae bacterium]|nr:type III-B CRISPR-associated protein Cas10/Cmr2 [Nitrospirota bacterium]